MSLSDAQIRANQQAVHDYFTNGGELRKSSNDVALTNFKSAKDSTTTNAKSASKSTGLSSDVLASYANQITNANNNANQMSIQQAQINRDFQEYMSNTSHQREVADLAKAGLNPILSANNGASTPSGATASISDNSSNLASLLGGAINGMVALATTSMNNANQLQMNKDTLAQQKLLGLLGLDMSKYQADLGYNASVYASNNAKQASMYAAMMSNAAAKYSSDMSYAASKYGSDNSLLNAREQRDFDISRPQNKYQAYNAANSDKFDGNFVDKTMMKLMSYLDII